MRHHHFSPTGIVLFVLALFNLHITHGQVIPDLIIEGNQDYTQFGVSSAAADFNNDGFNDLVIGAPAYAFGQSDEGVVFIHNGSAAGINPAYSSRQKNQVEAYLGTDVDAAGDVNGDGFPDAVFGAPFFDNGQTNEGAVYVYWGTVFGLTTAEMTTIEVNQSEAYLGDQVAGAGDVNNDGYDDIIIAAPNFDNGQTDEGAVYLHLGSASGISSTPTLMLEGNQASCYFGSTIAAAGDLNNDGFDDVLISAVTYDNGEVNEGMVFIYYGNASGLNTTPAYTLEANQAGAYFGRGLSGNADVNNDGFTDIAIGADFYSGGQTWEGRVFIFHGTGAGINTAPATIVEANQNFAHFGGSLDIDGDVNNDGYSDLIVGAKNYVNGEANEGAVFLYYGTATGINPTGELLMEGNQINAYLGVEANFIEDVNGDGSDEMLAGVWYYDNGSFDEGAVFIVYGDLCAAVTFYADVDGDSYGDAASTTASCSLPVGYVTNDDDCDDANAFIHPGAAEICNGFDDNCNANIDEGLAPVINITADGPTTFCSGSGVVLSAVSTELNYQWNRNGIPISGAISANYTATLKGTYTCSSIGCGSAVSNEILVNVVKNPKASITAGGPTTFCAGGSVTLTELPSGGCTYQWYKGATAIAGATTTTYVATTAGNYKCRVTKTATGCFKNSNPILVAIPCKEGEELLQNSNAGFTMYPNPATNVLQVTINEELSFGNMVVILDALGNFIYQQSITAASFTIPIEALPAGVYFVRIVGMQQSESKTFIKQ